MKRTPVRSLTALALLGLALAGCSRNTEPTPPPPPPPPPVGPPPPPPRVASIEISPGSLTLEATKTGTFTATPKDSAGNPLTGRTITWSTDNASVASIDAGGVVTANGMGSTSIHAAADAVSASATVTVTRQAFAHVFIVTLENRDYATVIGSSAMPYLNSLASRFALGSQFYANTHPSVGNYFMMTVGDTVTNNDVNNATVTADNVVRQLLAAGKTWKSYAESIPSTGYVGGDQGLYTRHHNPLSYFSDVVNSSAQRQNLQPLSQLAADISSGSLPNYGFIVPNSCNDGHDCDNATVDAWLRANIEPLITSSAFQNSLLVITYDESSTDNTNGGGRIPFIVVSDRATTGTLSTAHDLPDLLRLSLEALGITSWPGAAAHGRTMWEFFTR